MCPEKGISVFNYILYPMLLNTLIYAGYVLSIDGLKIGACMYPIVFVCVCVCVNIPCCLIAFGSSLDVKHRLNL